MSLSTPVTPPQFRYGIIVSKAFDHPDLLGDLFAAHFDRIAHIYTTGSNDLVVKFALECGAAITIFPITGGRCLPWAVSQVVDASDALYIIADPDSKSAEMAAEKCAARAAKDEKFKWKVIPFEPVGHWKRKVHKANEILMCAMPEDQEKNGWMKSVGKALDS